jgi:alpha-mannosidase
VWLREKYPQLYERIVEKAREGRFFGVGGSWIEMDGNLPSGESFVRQLLYGQREFQQVFGQ